MRHLVLLLVFCVSMANAQAPYVGSYEALNNFNDITSAEMDVLRTKKILFASRSFGLNLRNGLQLLANADATHNILNSYNRWDPNSAGGDLTVIPSTAFDSYNFVHFLATYWPHTRRVEEMEEVLTTGPWNFSEDADVVMIYFHTALESAFGTYSARMDSMQAANPHIKFIYVCAGYMDSGHAGDNANSDAFNALVLAKYKNVAPVYDLAAILSRDGECGSAYCSDYSSDPAGVHPNEDAGEIAMAKGFLVILKEVFFGSTACTSTVAPSVPAGLTGAGQSTTSIKLDWDVSTHAECGIKYYEIRRDGSVIGSSYDNTYTDNSLTEGTQYTYEVNAVSAGDVSSAWSSPVQVSTLSDNTAPTLVAAADTRDSISVVLEFSEDLDRTSAETAANYSINNGITVVSASLSGNFVTLTTSAMTSGTTYMVTVNNVTDDAAGKNPVAANSQTTFTYSPLTYSDDAIGYWAFDGDVADGSDSSHDGSWNGTAAYTTGYAGQALDMDGTSDGPYVMISDAAHLDGMANLTLSIWAKKTDAATGGNLLKKHVAYDLTVGSSTVGGYLFNETGDRVNIGASGVANNDTEWHHYCVVYDGANLVTYVDGAVADSDPQTGNVAAVSQGIYVAKDPWGNSFAGIVDEFKIFNRALDSTEVVALFSGGGSTGNADSLAVKALLDANGDLRNVDNVAVFDTATGRVTKLYIQTDLGGTMTTITSHIGQLTELTMLHVYGPGSYDHSESNHLTSVDPAIANCTKLTEVLFNDNDLTSLPDEITALTGLTTFSAGNNKLCGITGSVRTWLDTYDPDWETTQECTDITAESRRPMADNGISFELSSGKLVIFRAAADGPMKADVHTLDGQRVYSIQSCCDTQMEWRMAGFGSGLYMVTVTESGKTYTEKVMVVQ